MARKLNFSLTEISVQNRERKHSTFSRRGQQQEVSCFCLKLSLHNHIYSAKYLSPLEVISLKIWKTLLSWHAKCSVPVAVRVSKRGVLNWFFSE